MGCPKRMRGVKPGLRSNSSQSSQARPKARTSANRLCLQSSFFLTFRVAAEAVCYAEKSACVLRCSRAKDGTAAA